MSAEPAEPGKPGCISQPLSAVSDADAQDAIRTVLTDSDQVMAESAVVRYLHAKAPTLHADQYQPWSERVASVLRDHRIARRRLEEWTLLRSIAADGAWSTTELAGASDWLQRKWSIRPRHRGQ